MNLLLLHGAIGSKHQLSQLADALSKECTIHMLNFSGHGGKPFREYGFDIPAFAEEVNNYLEKNQIKTVDIFGYSMGGYVALYLALKYPKKVNMIVTLATKFTWTEAIAAEETRMLDPEIISVKVPKFAEILHERHAPNDWKEVLHKTSAMMWELAKRNALSYFEFRQIAPPVLLLLGDGDKMVSREETSVAALQLINGRMQILPNTKHPIEQTNIAGLAEAIISFLEEGHEDK